MIVFHNQSPVLAADGFIPVFTIKRVFVFLLTTGTWQNKEKIATAYQWTDHI